MDDRFVSYKFVDSNGVLRDKVVKMSGLKETYFDGSSFGFCPTNKSDLILLPDSKSTHYDPIRKMLGVFCFLRHPNGDVFDKCFRTQAAQAEYKVAPVDYALFGVEPEFYVLKSDKTRMTMLPFGIDSDIDMRNLEQTKWYGSLPPVDKTQWLRDYITENLEKAGFDIEGVHHEVGPSQCEYSWRCGNLLETADKMLLFKYIVSAICDMHDLMADFQAKPFKELNGSGCHVHVSIPSMSDNPEHVEQFAQGLVDHYDELLEVCCVGESSMDRLVPGFEAPTKENNGWAWHDRTKTVRIPGAGGRVEFRLPDPDMNPYVALPLILKFGKDAVKK